jgi:type I restriction enzyme M protein
LQAYRYLQYHPYNRFFYGIPRRSSVDFATISHVLASLPENGRVIVVARDAALYRGGTEGEIRRNIISSDLIEAIIALPARLYEKTF